MKPPDQGEINRSAPMIACHNITFRYPGSETSLFEGLDLKIDAPGFHALFGPSGVGKTTLAKIISGDITASSGQVSIETPLPCLYTFNRERLPGWSPVGRHLEKTTPSGRETLRDALIDGFGLAALMGLRFSQLSMGQCNRVNLLRYLLQDFSILIMDESLANVDEKLRETIILGIKEIFHDKMFLYISHNLMEVSKFCREILVLGRPDNGECTMIEGRDYGRGYHLNKGDLDRTMLEIMNAF